MTETLEVDGKRGRRLFTQWREWRVSDEHQESQKASAKEATCEEATAEKAANSGAAQGRALTQQRSNTIEQEGKKRGRDEEMKMASWVAIRPG